MITYISHTEQAQTAALTDAHYEIRAFGLRMDNDGDTIARLQGEASVMTGLLAEAVAVLQTVEPECAAEDEQLTRLRTDIWAVLTAVAKRGGA